jgi:ABC-type multidrug transport system fused ATPase/permease subunit
MENKSLIYLLYEFWAHISYPRQRQLYAMLTLMLLTSIAEMISIASLVPFLSVLSNPELSINNEYLKLIIREIGVTEPNQLLLLFSILFGFAVLVTGIMRLLLLWATTRLSFAIGTDISIKIYRRTLYQPYSVHCSRNSSEIINGISTKVNEVIYGALLPLLILVSSSFILLAILLLLLSINTIITLLSFTGFGLIYFLIIKFTYKKQLEDSKNIAIESENIIKLLQEGLGGIRDILIDGNQDTHCLIYKKANSKLRKSQGNNLFISQSPRYGMEALGMILISLLAFIISKQESGIANAIPILGAVALGAQRLLPALQQAYGAFSSIRGVRSSLIDTITLLNQSLSKETISTTDKALEFKQCINLKKVSFRYGVNDRFVLNEINLTIFKGECVGFIGISGSGKSTLLDIIMGLLTPSTGTIEVDNQVISNNNIRSWQKNIAHVPQTIFLADKSIEENIAFGVSYDKINKFNVHKAALNANISKTVDTLPKKYNTIVGERGVQLSGGQRQRIGIARALYKNADILILDEATSALDSETEQTVMNSIENLDKNLTVLIVAHRITTLKNCTKIVELDSNGVKRIGTYNELFAN